MVSSGAVGPVLIASTAGVVVESVSGSPITEGIRMPRFATLSSSSITTACDGMSGHWEGLVVEAPNGVEEKGEGVSVELAAGGGCIIVVHVHESVMSRNVADPPVEVVSESALERYGSKHLLTSPFDLTVVGALCKSPPVPPGKLWRSILHH